jgi:anti-sigma factor RsiW
MTCAEFLDRYTDFRDGLIPAARESRRFERHLACCAACRRYDATVRRGVHALQQADPIEPSADFRRRLDARLARERQALVAVPAGAGIAAALFVTAAIALLALEGMQRPVVARAPTLPPVSFPKPVAHAGVPFVSFQDPRASIVAGNPNPYGTALVEPATAGR